MKFTEKYVSPQYKCQSFSKLKNISQTLNVVDQIVCFDEHRLIYGLTEDPWSLLSRFADGLYPDLQRNLRLNFHQTLEDAYHKTQEIKTLSKYYTFQRPTLQGTRFWETCSFIPTDRIVGPSSKSISQFLQTSTPSLLLNLQALVCAQ